MREILFRAKRKDNGEWVYGYRYKDGIIISTDTGLVSLAVRVDPKTFCQYVDLKDKNGTKIFERDIVKTKYGRLCEVCWLNVPSFCGYDLKPLECKNPYPTPHDLYHSCNLEVVGNKFDNPELLEV